MQIHQGSQWFFRATIPHVVTQWPEPLPPFGPAIFSQGLLWDHCSRKREHWKSHPINKMLLSRNVTSIHNQWVTTADHKALAAGGREVTASWCQKKSTTGREWVLEVSPTAGLSNYTWNVLSTGTQCSINRAEWGDEAKSPEQGDGEKGEKNGGNA